MIKEVQGDKKRKQAVNRCAQQDHTGEWTNVLLLYEQLELGKYLSNLFSKLRYTKNKMKINREKGDYYYEQEEYPG